MPRFRHENLHLVRYIDSDEIVRAGGGVRGLGGPTRQQSAGARLSLSAIAGRRIH